MATSKPKAKRLHTPPGIGCFVNVFTPRQRTDAKGNPKGDPKYSILMYFPKGTDLSELQAEVKRVATEKFGPNAVAWLKNGKLHNPLRGADEFEEHGAPFTEPGVCVSFKSGDQPGVVDEDAQPLMSKRDFYSGVECRVSYRCFAYDNESKGVSFALVNVQKLGDGERLAGNPSAEDDFGPAGGGGSKRSSNSRDQDDDDDLLG